MGLSTRIGIGAAIVAVAGGGLIVGPLDVADANRAGGAHPVLIEQADCGGTAVDDSGGWPAALGSQQEITVTVPRMALIRVDAAGDVRAAMTNTGCAPRAGDDYFVIEPDGSITAAAADDFAGRRWVGNFTVLGRYVAQAGAAAKR